MLLLSRKRGEAIVIGLLSRLEVRRLVPLPPRLPGGGSFGGPAGPAQCPADAPPAIVNADVRRRNGRQYGKDLRTKIQKVVPRRT
jgi:hypothetical protein